MFKASGYTSFLQYVPVHRTYKLAFSKRLSSKDWNGTKIQRQRILTLFYFHLEIANNEILMIKAYKTRIVYFTTRGAKCRILYSQAQDNLAACRKSIGKRE